MKIETKFNLGDFVYGIRQSYKDEVIPCSYCDGRGSIELPNKPLGICPDCYGKGGKVVNKLLEWKISTKSTIRNIRVSLYDAGYKDDGCCSNKELYMLTATGVGRGTLWESSLLFLTKEEAQSE